MVDKDLEIFHLGEGETDLFPFQNKVGNVADLLL